MISLKRIIKSGWSALTRNMALSIATVFIMTTVISLVTFLYFLSPVTDILIADVEQKVDVSVYFKEDALEEDIFQIKSEVAKIEEVDNVEYVSKDQAFETFVEKHKNDPVLIESLTEVGYNPFLASLSIKAKEATQYEQIVSFLEAGQFKDFIDKVDYYQRKPVIDKVYSFTAGVNKIGIGFSIIFGIIAVLIAFNTIRIAIHNSNNEISTMRLVGASNWFVRGPFLVQGIVVGFAAALIALLLTLGITLAIDGKIKMIIPNVSTFNIFTGHIFILFLIQVLTGVGLGVVSSLIAIRKYLKI